MSRAALLALSLAACGGASPSGLSLEAAAERERELPGRYVCILEIAETTPTPERCIISAEAGELRLESSGAAPLRGRLSSIAGGFHLSGELHCAGKGCPIPIETDFLSDEAAPESYSGIAIIDGGTLLRVQLRRD